MRTKGAGLVGGEEPEIVLEPKYAVLAQLAVGAEYLGRLDGAVRQGVVDLRALRDRENLDCADLQAIAPRQGIEPVNGPLQVALVDLEADLSRGAWPGPRS